MSSPCASAGPYGDILAFIQHASPFIGVPMETGKNVRAHACSSYCSRKASTLNRQSVYITSPPGSVNLKISISNLAGASHFFSLLPLWCLYLCQRPVVSLAVEYPSESGAPLSGEEGGEPPPPTTVHWDLGGQPHGCTAPVWEVSLTLATPSTALALPACWAMLPTS